MSAEARGAPPLSPGSPTAVPPRFFRCRIASLRLGLAIELAARNVIDAGLTGVGREVALDGMAGRASPGVLKAAHGEGIGSAQLGVSPSLRALRRPVRVSSNPARNALIRGAISERTSLS